ncbi:MAG: FtsW/RodA/SpoVE family cell cycle protein [Paludibacteraceae bacterium]|nr:FtsW/RodA/SpoVE family cell cycle protein [Paludibacteraceae bacterium]
MEGDTKQLFRHLFAGNKLLWTIAVLLFATSLIIIFSAIAQRAYGHPVNYLLPYEHHFMHILFGFFVMWCAQAVSYRRWRKAWWFIGIVALGGLLYVIALTLNNPDMAVNGAIRSFRIGPIDFQPNEVTKFALILFLADQLTLYQEDQSMTWKRFFTWFGVIGGFCALIAVQNLSTSIILFVVCMLVLYVGRVDMKYLGTGIAIVATGITIGALLIMVIPDKKLPGRTLTWKHRMENLLGDKQEEKEQEVLKFTDKNRQIMNCKVAVANGKTPCGPGNSHRREFMQLPYSDCVFAVAVEEWGWWAVGWITTLYLWLFMLCGRMARKCERPYPMLMITGLGSLILLQAFVAMGVNVQLGPVTGQPLPLISMGGFSIMMNALYFGILINISQSIEPANPKDADTPTALTEETEKKQ